MTNFSELKSFNFNKISTNLNAKTIGKVFITQEQYDFSPQASTMYRSGIKYISVAPAHSTVMANQLRKGTDQLNVLKKERERKEQHENVCKTMHSLHEINTKGTSYFFTRSPKQATSSRAFCTVMITS